MHSRIFQLTEAQLPIKERITSDGIPEWFCDSVADYVDDMEPEQRVNDVGWFREAFHGDCDIDAETGEVTFSADVKKHYFEQQFREFREMLGKLQAASFENFAGLTDRTETERNVYLLGEAYEKKFGFYVIDEESEIATLDAWVRSNDLTKTYFLGGIVDYHF